jgi:hypothetical protein
MSIAATKKHFSSVTSLRKFSPDVLARFLRSFPEYLAARGLNIPAPGQIGKEGLPFQAILDACMARDIDPELNRVLFIASHMGNAAGVSQIRDEHAQRRAALPADLQLHTHYDVPLLVWLARTAEHPDILEQSYARVRIHSKSSYRYYAPTRDALSRYRKPNRARMDELRATLAEHFTDKRNGKAVNVLDYDYEHEIWFLIRYPGQPVRPDAVNTADGSDADAPYVPRQYDAVVFHKTYGDLRMNTNRHQDHKVYRMAFGDALLQESNIFHPTLQIITLAPIRAPCRHLFLSAESDPYPRVRPVEVCFNDLDIPGRRITWRANVNDSHLFQYTTDASPDRLLPSTVDTVHKATFRYTLSGTDTWHSMTVHQGMDLRFERDGDSAMLESWLRERGFIIDVLKKAKPSAR